MGQKHLGKVQYLAVNVNQLVFKYMNMAQLFLLRDFALSLNVSYLILMNFVKIIKALAVIYGSLSSGLM